MGSSSTKNFRGGVNTESTPANNLGGGAGLGDSGYPKGNTSTTGQFNTLRNQKAFAQEHDEHSQTDSQSENRNFMAHKPGHSDTLPGWEKVKDFAGYTS